MTSVQGRGCPRRKHFFVTLPDSFSLPKSKFFKQPARPLRPKSSATDTDVPKYSKDNLQQILKTVLEAQAPASVPVLACATSEKPQDKPLKARSPKIYYEKSYMDFYNFCQQCEDYFATAEATKPNQILFAVSFL